MVSRSFTLGVLVVAGVHILGAQSPYTRADDKPIFMPTIKIGTAVFLKQNGAARWASFGTLTATATESYPALKSPVVEVTHGTGRISASMGASASGPSTRAHPNRKIGQG